MFSGTIFRLSLQKSYSDTACLVGLAVSHNKFVLLVVGLCTLVLSLYEYIWVLVEPQPRYIRVLRNSNAMKSFQIYCEETDVV